MASSLRCLTAELSKFVGQKVQHVCVDVKVTHRRLTTDTTDLAFTSSICCAILQLGLKIIGNRALISNVMTDNPHALFHVLVGSFTSTQPGFKRHRRSAVQLSAQLATP